ncbi:MAG: molybdopterin oxidoreductase family protein [Rhodospirillales bacterium]
MPETRNSVSEVWGRRTFHENGRWPERVDQRILEEPDRWVQSCCVLCSNGCGMDIGVKDGRIVGVRGRAVDRVNKGRLGPKGLHGWEANNSSQRLTRPLIRRGGDLQPASWDEAMGLLVGRVKEIRDRYTTGALAFYDTGQLFLEEYHALSMIVHGGLHALNIDGNTRLCTATAAVALRESFGSDGQPASYSDIDVTECIFLAGHNVANTQTVLWMRMLDRLEGPNPPKLVVVDPRRTATAARADVHLAPRVGANVALMNGLLNLVIRNGHIDREFIDRHTTGFERLASVVSRYTPQRVEEITKVPAAQLEAAADILGSAKSLVSTVLQGFYQSNQATAAAVQVNNLNLIRGMIGKPGAGVFQMNGQPTSQNTRETGCDGEFPGFLNWRNPRHMRELAKRWNVEEFPHWQEPMHVMEILRNAEMGAIKFLWIICTNPAVSLPELHRVREILSREKLFVVVQDAFLTETAALADLVLPAAIWGEKTGTFTNTDRTVHISFKAVEPPGEARSDLDILLDFARRMDFRDKDGAPLLKFYDPESAFNHWREITSGELCDYSGLSYEKLTGGSGIQYPCNDEHPGGTERLYTDGVFPTAAERCESFGHDLETGAAVTMEEYRANDPNGRAILKAAEYIPPIEEPDSTYPFWLTTGRTVYQFHTRTKTGRSPELASAVPDVFAQLSEHDAAQLGISEGDWVEVASRRGSVQARARIGDIAEGHVFLPFHFGYWDEEEGRHRRAANELTITGWDPISKQPYFKFAAVQIRKLGAERVIEKAAALAGKAKQRGKEAVDKAMSAAHVERSHVSDYIGAARETHEQFARACGTVSTTHMQETELIGGLKLLARFSEEAAASLGRLAEKYGEKGAREADNLAGALFPAARPGAFGLLRDLQSLYVLSCQAHTVMIILLQSARMMRDPDLRAACEHILEQVKRQQAWLKTQIEHRAAQTVVVPA